MMAYWIFVFLLLAAMSSETIGKTFHQEDHQQHYEDHEPKDYSFSYGVKDYHTGDIKNQWEKKIGDTVHGHYSMVEADGSLRIVEYTADDKNGFHATVKHEGPSYHPLIHIKPISHKEQSVKLPEPKAITYFLVPDIKEFEVKQEQQEEEESSEGNAASFNDLTQFTEQDFASNVVNNFPQDIILNVETLTTKTPSDSEKFQSPDIETGFKPMKPYSKPMIPNTFISNKKPVSTPGLKAYSTRNGFTRGPVLFPRGQKEVERNMKVTQKPKGLIAYTKHITYFPDDF